MEKISYISSIPSVLLDNLLNQTLVPVIGAGFSANAKTSTGETPPLWNKLGNLFAKEISNYPDTGNALDNITLYEKKFQRGYMCNKLEKFLLIKETKPSTAHLALSKLPLTTYITTNFDFLIEESFDELNIPYKIIYSIADVARHRDGSKKIIKIHGDLKNQDNIIITRDDYLNVESRNKIYRTVLKTIMYSNTLLLIGYCLSDPDFIKITEEVSLELKKDSRPPFALLINPEEKDIEKFEKLKVIPVPLRNPNSKPNEVLTQVFDEMASYFKKEERKQLFSKGPVDFEKFVDELEELKQTKRNDVRMAHFYELLLNAVVQTIHENYELIVTIYQCRKIYENKLTPNYVPLDRLFFIYDFIKSLLVSKKEEIERLDAYVRYTELVRNSPFLRPQIGRPYTFFGRYADFSEWDCFSHILTRILYEIANYSKVNVIDLFNKMYDDLEIFLTSEDLRVYAISPLYNFFMPDVTSIDLSDTLTIRRITDREFIKVRAIKALGENDLGNLENVKYGIVYNYQLDRNFQNKVKESPPNIYSMLESVVACLRLFRRGNVGIYSVSQILEVDIPIEPAHTGLYAHDLGISIGEYYTLDKPNITKFKAFWNGYSHILMTKVLDGKRFPNDKYERIKNSMQNFLFSYNKKDSNDRYSNLVRALLSLSLGDNESLHNSEGLVINRCVNLCNVDDELNKEKLTMELTVTFDTYKKIMAGGNPQYDNLLSLIDITKNSLIEYLYKLKSASFTHQQLINKL